MSAPLSMPANGTIYDVAAICDDCGARCDPYVELSPVGYTTHWRLRLCFRCACLAIEVDGLSIYGLGSRPEPPSIPPSLWWQAA